MDSAAKSTPLLKSYRILSKIEPNTYLKSLPCKASTPLNEKYRVSAICRLVSIGGLDAFFMQFSMFGGLTYHQNYYISESDRRHFNEAMRQSDYARQGRVFAKLSGDEILGRFAKNATRNTT
jgi:hypothetical protein